MFVIETRNVHQALPDAMALLDSFKVERQTRNGPVLMFPEPVTTVYLRPMERVMFWPERDANPFFHFMECLWMLDGRNDVGMPARYAANIKNYSDDGLTLNGAYGHRWRHHFKRDQLVECIQLLGRNREDRRVMLGMWDPATDLGSSSKDVPCNTIAHFRVTHENKLDMSVFCRSNDMVWGCYGANAVHFSFLLEFVASAVGVDVGRYRQISDDLHAYVGEPFEKVKHLGGMRFHRDPYITNAVTPYPIMGTDWQVWLNELGLFLDDGLGLGIRERFFRKVARPIRDAHAAYSNRADPQRFLKATCIMQECVATDWRLACLEWLGRRKAEHERKRDASS